MEGKPENACEDSTIDLEAAVAPTAGEPWLRPTNLLPAATAAAFTACTASSSPRCAPTAVSTRRS